MNLIPFTAILNEESVNINYDDKFTEFDVDGYQLIINGKPVGHVSTLYNQHIMVNETITNINEPYKIVWHGNLSNRVLSLSIVGDSYLHFTHKDKNEFSWN